MKIIDLIKPYFLGKTFKYLVANKQVTQDYLLRKKKSHSVTDAQFESGIPKYAQFVTRTKVIGRHLIFESSEIIDIKINHYDSCEDYTSYLELKLKNGTELAFEFDDQEIVEIDKNTIMFKNNILS
jgi:hypothetical protein